MVEKVGRRDLWVLWTKLPYKIFRITQILLSNFPLETPLVFLRELSFCRSPPRHICHQHNNNSWKSKWANRSSSTILTAQEPLFLYSLLFPSVFLDSVVLVVLVIWVVLELLHFVWTLSQSRLIYLHFFFFFVILENYRFFFVLECGSLHQKYKSNIC